MGVGHPTLRPLRDDLGRIQAPLPGVEHWTEHRTRYISCCARVTRGLYILGSGAGPLHAATTSRSDIAARFCPQCSHKSLFLGGFVQFFFGCNSLFSRHLGVCQPCLGANPRVSCILLPRSRALSEASHAAAGSGMRGGAWHRTSAAVTIFSRVTQDMPPARLDDDVQPASSELRGLSRPFDRGHSQRVYQLNCRLLQKGSLVLCI